LKVAGAIFTVSYGASYVTLRPLIDMGISFFVGYDTTLGSSLYDLKDSNLFDTLDFDTIENNISEFINDWVDEYRDTDFMDDVLYIEIIEPELLIKPGC